MHVKEQSNELCTEAVKQNGLALGYVENKIYEVCKEALKQNRLSPKYA